jgi:hypothetical protein
MRAWHTPLWGAAGLILIAVSFSLTREGHGGAPVNALFWVGFVTMISPITARLLSEATPRSERIALVTLVGLLAYAVKVLRDPLMFVMSDEFIHLAAAQRIAATHKLFESLPLSGVTVAGEYPGLETVTVTVSEITGLSLFCSGLIVIGIARAIVMMAIFELYDRVSGSPRIAGLGALLFAANGNFLYWSAQFSYESLAMPLFVLALALYAMRARRPTGRLPLTLTLVLLTATITATHHLTSYALAASLWILALLSLRKAWAGGRGLGLALLATATSTTWLLLVATRTQSYLGYVLRRTVDTLASAANGTHGPFQASAGSLQTPIVEQLVSFAGVLLVVAALLWTLKSWTHRGARRIRALFSPAGLLFAACALVFLSFYPLRLFPGAWETANRGQEFLFIGAALLLGLAVVRLAGPPGARRRRSLLVGAIVVVICGGVISGWPTPLLLSQPLEVRVGSAVIVPQGLSVASWATRELPPNSIYVGDEATGRELLVDGAHFTYFGPGDDTPELLESPHLQSWLRALLADRNVDYIVLDRRKISANNQSAFFFRPASDPSGGFGYYPDGVRAKFAIPTVSSIFDSGDIVVYDVRALHEPPPECSAVGVPSQASGITCRQASVLLTIAGPNATIELPQMTVRLLHDEIQRRTAGLYVAILLQVQNAGNTSYLPDRDWRHLYLTVAGHRIYRLRSVAERKDNLNGRKPLAPGRSQEGSVSFIIRNPGLIAGLLRTGAQLRVQPPSPPARASSVNIGVIAIRPPATGSVK